MDKIKTEPSGGIVINKPAGMTSHDVVGRIRRIYNTRTVGHAGTLDPMATGLLLVLIGRGVKATEYVQDGDKSYLAGIRFGMKSDTEDIWGEVETVSAPLPTFSELSKVCSEFTGKQIQIPPMYSALKKDGQKLVDLARKGIEVEREGREIEVYSLVPEKTDREDEFLLSCRVSKGTYIRTLCRDIGERLGCSAVMSSLRRDEACGISLIESHTLSELEEMTEEEKNACVIPTERFFSELPTVRLSDFFSHLAHSGAEVYQKKIGTCYDTGARVRLYDQKGFFALGEIREYKDGSAIKPIKQFVL